MYTPLRGWMVTKPSASSLRSASRNGVRLTPSSSQRAILIQTCPVVKLSFAQSRLKMPIDALTQGIRPVRLAIF